MPFLTGHTTSGFSQCECGSSLGADCLLWIDCPLCAGRWTFCWTRVSARSTMRARSMSKVGWSRSGGLGCRAASQSSATVQHWDQERISWNNTPQLVISKHIFYLTLSSTFYQLCFAVESSYIWDKLSGFRATWVAKREFVVVERCPTVSMNPQDIPALVSHHLRKSFMRLFLTSHLSPCWEAKNLVCSIANYSFTTLFSDENNGF